MSRTAAKGAKERDRLAPSRVAAPSFTASGEALLPVVRSIDPQPDGTNRAQISFRMSDAPSPDRRYTADIAGIVSRDDVVYGAFGQVRMAGGLRALVIVKMYAETVRRFLATCEQFGPSLSAFLGRNKIKPATLMKDIREPEQTVELSANLLAAGYAGREAVIDFYHTSAMAIHRMNANNDSTLAVEPIVRVQCSTAMLGAFIDEMRKLSSSLPEEAL